MPKQWMWCFHKLTFSHSFSFRYDTKLFLTLISLNGYKEDAQLKYNGYTVHLFALNPFHFYRVNAFHFLFISFQLICNKTEDYFICVLIVHLMVIGSHSHSHSQSQNLLCTQKLSSKYQNRLTKCVMFVGLFHVKIGSSSI